ncbi:putative LysM peptidoglycan-binding domain-containing protein [uncultured Gammaproteobacteria bacterium]
MAQLPFRLVLPAAMLATVIANPSAVLAQQSYVYGGSPIMPIAVAMPPAVAVPPAMAGMPMMAPTPERPSWRSVTMVTYPAMAAPAAPVGYATQTQTVSAATVMSSVPRGYYTIVKGGRLADVAHRTGTHLSDLRRLNPALSAELTLPPGTVVALPKAWTQP